MTDTVSSRHARHVSNTISHLSHASGLIMPYLPLYVAFFALLGLSYGFPYSNCTGESLSSSQSVENRCNKRFVFVRAGKEGSPPPSTLGKTVAITSVPPCAAAPCEVHPSEVLNLTITFVPSEFFLAPPLSSRAHI